MVKLVKDILGLSVSERIQIVADIWDSIAETPEAVVLTGEQKAELEKRLELYHQDPSKGSPWAEVWERIKDEAKIDHKTRS